MKWFMVGVLSRGARSAHGDRVDELWPVERFRLQLVNSL